MAGKGVFRGSLIGIAGLKFELDAQSEKIAGSGKGGQGNNGKPIDDDIDDETNEEDNDDAVNNFCPRQKGHQATCWQRNDDDDDDDDDNDDDANNFCPRQKGHLLAKE